jgi:hypothetical protein
MVKTPRTRHSKTNKEPVTIDLSPEEISRIKADEEKRASQERQATANIQPGPPPDPKPEPVASAAAAKTPTTDDKLTGANNPETANVKPTSAATASSTSPASATSPSSASSTASASSSASPNFGRTPEAAKPSAPSPDQTPPPAQKSRAGSSLLAGVAGGVIALLLAGGAQYAGLIPTPTAPSPQQQDLSPSIEQLQAELASLRQEVSALPTATVAAPEVEGRVALAEKSVTTLAEQLYAVRDEVAGLAERGEGDPAAGMVDLTPVESRIAALETATADLRQATNANGNEERLAALSDQVSAARETQAAATSRIDTIERSLEELTARVTEAASQPSTAIIVAASALKAAIDRGGSFMTEIETYASLKPDSPEIAELRDLAASGVPTSSQLAGEADAAANAMIASVRTVDPDAGITDRLWASAMGLVQVRPVGMVEGEGVPEIAARLDAAIQAGDLERALREFDAMPAVAKAAGEPFMAKVRARAAADRLADQALAAALQN